MPIMQVKTWKYILQQLIALSKARDTRQAASVTAMILWLHSDSTLLKPIFVARIQQQERCLPIPYVPATNWNVSCFIMATTSLGVYILLIGHRNNPPPILICLRWPNDPLQRSLWNSKFVPRSSNAQCSTSDWIRLLLHIETPNHHFWIDLLFNGIPMLTVPASPFSTTSRRWIMLTQHSHWLNCSILARPRFVSSNFYRRSDQYDSLEYFPIDQSNLSNDRKSPHDYS